MRQKNIILRSIALIMLFSVWHIASALTITPVRLEIAGNPGQTLTEQITLINEQKTNTTFYSSYANFEASGETGNPSFVDAKEGIGTWMTTDPSITLKSGESKTVEVKIAIPANAEPGGHFGAVFFGTLPQDVKNSQVGIGAKVGTLILLSVAGDVKEGGGLLDFNTTNHQVFYNSLPVTFTYRFKNDGGDRIKPTGTITMHDLVYLPADSIDANPTAGNILPASTRRFEATWIKHPRADDYQSPANPVARFFDQAGYQWHNFAIGPYFAKINLLYGTSATRVTKTIFIFVFPWQLLVIIIIVLLLIWWIGRKLITSYNRHIIERARQAHSPHDATHA